MKMKKFRCFRCGFPIGAVLFAVGIFIILALVLPTSFWWYVLGFLLIVLGVLIIIK